MLTWLKFLTDPFKEKHASSITKDAEVAEIFARESSALHSHLLWLTDLLVVLNDKMANPHNRATIHPIVAQVLEHQKWVQVLLSDSLTLLSTNTMLVQWDLASSTRRFRRRLHGT